MDSERLFEAIPKRRSERRFASRQMTQGVFDRVLVAMKAIEPAATSVRTQLRLYVHGEVKGYTPWCVAAFADDSREGMVNAGFMLEQIDLWFAANGFGSCWLGAAKPPSDTPHGFRYAASVCFGTPTGAPRSALSDFDRKPLSKITSIPSPGTLIETAHLAPSALNRQPWFFSGSRDNITISTKRVLVAPRLTELDAGIALLYICLAAEHEGRRADINLYEGGAAPPKHVFQANVRIEDA